MTHTCVFVFDFCSFEMQIERGASEIGQCVNNAEAKRECNNCQFK
jgi:hypothetical protein